MGKKEQLDEEIAQRENILFLKEHYRRRLPVLREVFLTRKLTRTEIMEGRGIIARTCSEAITFRRC